ncbi:MAG: hypothetical protein LBF93_05900 [Zoogloeaceae bacterium]|jgi:hypothetical protein|nr:hypothetical protein [Zoogloeaceae bacterium]
MAMVFRVAREMRTARVLCLSACFFALLPLEGWGWGSPCGTSHRQILYDNADAIVLARFVGPGPEGYKDPNPEVTFDVIRSWKSEISGLLTVQIRKIRIGWSSYWRRLVTDNIRILYLRRDENGKFWTSECSGNVGMPVIRADETNLPRDPRVTWMSFDTRLRWLDEMARCKCPSRSAEGWYDHADAVVRADVTRVTENGAEKFADLEIQLSWKTDLPDFMTVRTDDGQGCGFPVEEGRKYRGYLLFLRRDETGQYSTDFCSGNLEPSAYTITLPESGVSRVKWLFKRETPKKHGSAK